MGSREVGGERWAVGCIGIPQINPTVTPMVSGGRWAVGGVSEEVGSGRAGGEVGGAK